MAITHRNLDYESKERRKLNLVVPFLSQKLYELDKALGKHRVDDRPITLSLEFRWDLPETCQIEYEESWVECQDEVKQGDDGKFLLKEINTKINCGESTMMKAIFKPQDSNSGV